MPQNTTPIFPLVPNIGFAKLTTANTAKDGTGSNPVILTAGANGARLDTIKARGLGTNVATVLRIFLNNGTNQEVATNNTLYMEQTLAATTLSEVAMLTDVEVALDIMIPAGWKVLVAIGTTVAAGYSVTAIGGDY